MTVWEAPVFLAQATPTLHSLLYLSQAIYLLSCLHLRDHLPRPRASN